MAASKAFELAQLVDNLAGIVVPFAGASAPDGFLLCSGSAVSRSTYSRLFSVIGTTFGVGDGSTTFNLPDMRGRAAAGKDNMGGTSAGRLTVQRTGTLASTSNGVITGLTGTSDLSMDMLVFGTGIAPGAAIQSIDSSSQVTLTTPSTVTGAQSLRFASVDGFTMGASGGSHIRTLSIQQIPPHNHSLPSVTNRNTVGGGSDNVPIASSGSSTFLSNATGGGQAHQIVQPTIILNYIIKY